MALTPRLKFPYPNEERAYWFQQFESFAQAVDAGIYAMCEDRQWLITGGGMVSWDAGTGTMTWSAPLVLPSATVGFLLTVPAGSVVLDEREFLFFKAERAPIQNLTISLRVGPRVPENVPEIIDSVLLGYRLDGRLYLRGGLVMNSGENRPVFSEAPGIAPTLLTAGNPAPLAPPVVDSVALYLQRAQNAPDTLWVYSSLDGWQLVGSGTIQYEADVPALSVVGQLVRVTGPSVFGVLTMGLADPSSTTTMPATGIIVSKSLPTRARVVFLGVVVPGIALVPGRRYFVGAGSVVGGPGVSGVVQAVGHALDTTRLLFNPSSEQVVRA